MKKAYIFKTVLLLSIASLQAESAFINGLSEIARNSAGLISGIAKGTGKLALDTSKIGKMAHAFPRTAAAVAGVSSLGAYGLYCCYLNYMNQDAPSLITAAREYTQFLDTNSLAQAGKPLQVLMYWRNCYRAEQPLLPNKHEIFAAPAEIITYSPAVWNLLKQDLQVTVKDYTDNTFKIKMLGQIESEKSQLSRIRQQIDQKIENSFGKQLISKELRKLGLDVHGGMTHLTKDNIKHVSNSIDAYYNLSHISWNHLELVKNNFASLYNKLFASRFEGELVKQYWKLSILLARLDALNAVLSNN